MNRRLEREVLSHSLGAWKRKIYPVVPPKVEYSLTSYGKDILPILEQIHKFGLQMYKNYENSGSYRKALVANKLFYNQIY